MSAAHGLPSQLVVEQKGPTTDDLLLSSPLGA